MSDEKMLFASDIHFPKHDPRAVELWFEVLKWLKPSRIHLLGDLDESENTSRWAEGTSKEGFSMSDGGVTGTKQFLHDVAAKAKTAEKHFHDGNHGWYRHKKYLDKNMPTTLIDGTYTPEILYDYKNAGFEWHEYDKPPVPVAGGLWGHHGESISKHAGESARNDALNWGVSIIRGHSHRQGEFHQDFPLEDRRVSGYEIGHMCDPKKMDYVINPNWQMGFAYGLATNNDFFIDTVEVKNYQCYVAGKLFKG